VGHAMTQVVGHRPVTTESCVHIRVNPCGICGGHSGTLGQVFLRIIRFSPVCIIPPEAVLGIGNIGFCLGPRAFRGVAQTYACQYNRNYSRKGKNFNFTLTFNVTLT
jgi:hypothetical protein